MSSFAAGQLLAGRFRIVRLLARGGMGEVYEAEDLDLNERVALKAVRQEIGDDEQSLERFKREVQLARKVTHPNVCRTFDSVRHRPEGARSDVVLVTMELLQGETLSERLKRSGAMAPGEALPLVKQMADALQAAHDAGVIHRDFKSANVMLEGSGESTRAVVTDFGLARGAAIVGADGQATAQATSAFIGTPEYMAPEQVEGGAITPAADVYALGVVMYEMVTGKCPFSGTTPLEIMVRRLKEPPRPPRRHVAGLDPLWEAVILRCLERDPRDRFASAADVARALVGAAVPAAAGAGARRRQRLAALSLLALVALGALGYEWRARRGSAPQVGRSLAVLPFSALQADESTAHLGMGMADAITARLLALRRVPVASTSRVLHWTGRGLDPLAAGRNLDVDSVLTGTFQREGQRMRVTAELTSVRDGSSLWSDRYDAAFTDILGVQDQIAERIAARLVADLTGAERQQLKSHGTDDLEAYELYAKARYHWTRRTPEQIRVAISEFQQATERDPRFALAFAGLANAYAIAASGLPPPERFPKAQQAARRALELDEGLAEAHTALAFVSYRWEWSFAAADASFRRAIALRPDYVLAHHWRGELLSLLGRTEEAAASLRRAIELEPESVPARVDLCWALNRAKRYDEAAAACREAEALDAKEWRAPRGLGLAFEGLGRGDEAIQHYLRSEALRGANAAALAELRAAYDTQGIAGYWRGRIALIQRAASGGKALPYGSAGALAVIYAGIGEREEALRWLAASLLAKDEGPLSLLDPRWDALRSDARFVDLKRQVGL